MDRSDTRSRPGRVIAAAARRPFVAGGFAVLFAWFAWYAQALPEPLFDKPYSVILEDRDGVLLGARIAADGQWRFPLSSSDVSPRFSTALIAFEDRRFYWHHGIDPVAVLRAAGENFRAGKVVSGASTLSMQLIRMSRDNPPRTLGEKIYEAILATRLEWRYEKKEILALYAAHAPFGGNVVGLEAAAWRYFGRSPDNLSWAEAATLAVLPNSPGLIHPGRDRDALKRKRNALLQQLAEQGHLDARQLQLALLEPLPAAPRDLPTDAQHLLATLVRKHPEQTRFPVTLDRNLQRTATRRAERHGRELAAQGVHNLAALIIDNQKDEVVAYVGNVGDADSHGGAMDLVQRPRSTGSLLKPFLFGLMLEAGEIQPTSLLPDVPVDFAGFRPENYDRQYRGAVPASDALAQSLNVPAVFMLQRHGTARFQYQLEKLGLSTLFRKPEDYGLSLILGGAEGTLFELTSAYAGLAREHGANGWQPALLAHESPASSETESLVGKGAAWLTLNALLEVNRPGAEQYWRRFASSRRIAWKTGTSFGLRDGWAIGVTPNYSIGVWVGNASGEGRAGLTGSGMAAPLLFELFAGLDAGGWFDRPEADLRSIAVCRADGYLPANDCETEIVDIPLNAHFATVSRYHRLVHIDAKTGKRVNADCRRVGEMKARSWFQLPPLQEFHYRQSHADYSALPQWAAGCALAENDRAFEIVYPMPGSRIYIPDDFGATRSRVVFSAAHRDSDALLYWHVNERFVGTTGPFHELALDLPAGKHHLVLVDEEGRRAERRFEVLAKDRSERNAAVRGSSSP